MTRLSRQTCNMPSHAFRYNPFTGAELHIFENGHRVVHRLMPVHSMEPDTDDEGNNTYRREALSHELGEMLYVEADKCAGNVSCYLYGEEIQHYSIVYPGRRHKKSFATI